MATTTRKVVRRTRKPSLPLNVPVNVKVKGERTMRKHVVLAQREGDPHSVRVLTGRRGRPAHLNLDSIERVRVL